MLTLSHSVSDRNADPILEFAKPVKEHLITSDTVLEDYQVMMDLDAITGTDSGDDAYGLEVETDGNNLVLLTEDGQVIPFWIEEHTGRARIWAKMPLISPNTCVKLLEYPRNYFPAPDTDGNNIFPFFDDFPGSSLDTTKWESSGTVTVGSGIVDIKRVGSNSDIRRKTATVDNDGTAMRCRVKTLHCDTTYREHFGYANDSYSNQIFISLAGPSGFQNVIRNWLVSTASAAALSGLSANTWFTADIVRLGKTRWQTNDSGFSDLTGNYPTADLDLVFRATDDVVNSEIFVDWVLYRKYAATEPTHSSWGDISIPSGDTGRFRYKKTHILTGDSGWSGDQTGYPIMLKVYRTSGTDSGSSVYVDTNVRTDYRDLLFMDGNGCILPHWIESINTTNNYAVVWVRMNTIAKTGNTTLNILYGNPRATDRSSGTAVFDFFDDFLGSAYDSSIWNTNGGTISVSGGIITLTSAALSGVGITSKTAFGQNYAVRSRFKSNAVEIEKWPCVGFDARAAGGTDYAIAYQSGPDREWGVGTYDTTNASVLGASADTSWHVFDVIRNGSTSVIVLIDGGSQITVTTQISSESIPATLVNYTTAGATASLSADWIAVRKFVSPEPAHGSWSTSEV